MFCLNARGDVGRSLKFCLAKIPYDVDRSYCRPRGLVMDLVEATPVLFWSSGDASCRARMARMAIALMIGLTATSYAGDRPDPQLTPGLADLALTKEVICAPGFTTYTIRYVPRARKKAIYKAYGLSPDQGDCPCELDHLIPLQLGGSNKPRNLWPQSYGTMPWNAHLKDRLEMQMHKEVCGGKTDLSAAQEEIATDWIKAYLLRFGQPPPVPAAPPQ
jgi:hypothetical protein